ncbi:MAG: GtrA family protein [Lachnospiraceae bacterium]|nr:GtrA family protein [Lachnospiraceae bacterium]
MAFSIDYFVLITLTDILGLNYMWAATISFVLANAVNYFMSMAFVYDKSENISGNTAFLIFIGLSIIGLLFNNVFLYMFVQHSAISYKVAKLITALIVTVYNFSSRKICLEQQDITEVVAWFMSKHPSTPERRKKVVLNIRKSL